MRLNNNNNHIEALEVVLKYNDSQPIDLLNIFEMIPFFNMPLKKKTRKYSKKNVSSVPNSYGRFFRIIQA